MDEEKFGEQEVPEEEPITQEQPAEQPEQPIQEQPRVQKPEDYRFDPMTGKPTGAYCYSAPYQTAYGTPRPQQYAARPAYTPQPAPAQPKKKKERKQVSHVWIPILLVIALLLGAGGGVLGYWIAAKNRPAAVQQQGEIPKETLAPSKTPDEPKEPISGNVHTNASEGAYTPAEIYSDYVNAVVGIASESTGKNVWGQTVTQASAGSGFVITADGYVVTNYHVVEGASNVTVQMYDGKEYPATVVGYENTTCDVALLKIEAENLSTVSIGDSDTIRVGEEVCAIGNPLGELTFTLTVGYVSALDREVNTDGSPINMFQTDAAINSGNSGGPLFDMDGNVIGITTAKYSGSTGSGANVEGLGFAIPINDVMALIDDLTQYGYVTGKPYLGVTVGDSARYGENLPAGAYIGEVVEGAAAQKAGLQAGDVIVGLGDSVVGAQSDLLKALGKYKAGDTVSVTVYREGQYQTVTVTLDERPREPQVQSQEPQQSEEETQTETEGFDFGDFGGFGFGWPFP